VAKEREIALTSWAEFEGYIREIPSHMFGTEDLFRGQPNADWPLNTTLERYLGRRISVLDYYQRISMTKAEIETHTGDRWDLMTVPAYKAWLQKQDILPFDDFPGYEYMIFLRHHGFPSPLLDWTHSPYIAAFFAFHNPAVQSQRVSIYHYQERPLGEKGSYRDSARIGVLGPHATSHVRHFRQQSRYTICTIWVRGELDPWYFAEHDLVFREGELDQDVLVKLTLPASERDSILHYLDRYNLNAFSLFGSDESLMQTMAFRFLM
jgi:hypothetical protein